jgi:diketogulonate reductase-like aldo/keto reductase
LPPAQLALAWLLGKPAVSAPIVGVTKAHHLDDALAAADLSLGDEEVARLEAPYRPRAPYGYAQPDVDATRPSVSPQVEGSRAGSMA